MLGGLKVGGWWRVGWARDLCLATDQTREELRVGKRINVVGGVIIREGLVLAVRRGPKQSLPGMWEFPGGKIEEAESPQEALAREVREELLCEIDVRDFITTTAHDYPFGTVVLSTYFCEVLDGDPQLTEHAEMAWLAPTEFLTIDWAPADIPTVDLVVELLHRPA